MYAAFMLRAGFSYPAEVLTYKSFCQMWHRDFPWVKTKRRKTIASKCFVCEDLEVLWGTTHVRGPWWRGGGGGGAKQYLHRAATAYSTAAYFSQLDFLLPVCPRP